jgi:hypothetical protein
MKEFQLACKHAFIPPGICVHCGVTEREVADNTPAPAPHPILSIPAPPIEPWEKGYTEGYSGA